MTINQKLGILEKARKEGASPAQLEQLCIALWPEKNVPEEADVIKAMASITEKRKSEEEEVHDLEKIVSNVLNEIGVPAHILGYQYLRRSIVLCINDAKMMRSITKVLYPTIAKEFETEPSRVERAVRHAIEVAWDRGNVEVYQKYFGYTISERKGKPTNHEFIAMMVNQIKLQYNL